MPAEESTSAQTVARAMHILRCFRGHDELGVSQVARLVGYATSTTHRLLRALVDAEMLEQDATSSRYRLCGTLAEYGLIAYRQHRVYLIEPHLERVAAATGCTSSLAIRHGDDAVMLGFSRWREADGHSLQGIRLPLHASGLGRALLAWAPSYEDQLPHMDLSPVGPGTPTTVDELRAELERTRERGYAVSNETDPSFRVIGTPVLDHDGHARYALGMRGPVELMTDARVSIYAELAREVAGEISATLIDPDGAAH